MLTKINQDGNVILQQVGKTPINTVTEDSIQKDLSEQGTDNLLINGGFDFAQRSLSDTVPAGAPKFVVDRWTTQINGTGATVTVSRQAATPGSIPGEPPYFWRYNQTVAGSGQTYADLALQRIEDVRTTAGKYITLSFYAYADTARTVTVSFYQAFDSVSTGVSIPGATFNLTTSWQKFSVTVRMPSVSGKTIGANSYSYVNIAANSYNTIQQYNLAQVMLNIGTKAAPFKRAGGDIQGELAKCQRYYEKSYQVDDPPLTNTTIGLTAFGGSADSSSSVSVPIQFAVRKRATPSNITGITDAGSSGNWVYSRNGAGPATATFSAIQYGERGFTAYILVGATWVVCGVWGHWTANAEF